LISPGDPYRAKAKASGFCKVDIKIFEQEEIARYAQVEASFKGHSLKKKFADSFPVLTIAIRDNKDETIASMKTRAHKGNWPTKNPSREEMIEAVLITAANKFFAYDFSGALLGDKTGLGTLLALTKKNLNPLDEDRCRDEWSDLVRIFGSTPDTPDTDVKANPVESIFDGNPLDGAPRAPAFGCSLGGNPLDDVGIIGEGREGGNPLDEGGTTLFQQWPNLTMSFDRLREIAEAKDVDLEAVGHQDQKRDWVEAILGEGMKLSELKAMANERGVTPDGNRTMKTTWASAILEAENMLEWPNMDMKLAKLIDFAEQHEVDKDAVSDKRKKNAWLVAIVLEGLGLIDLRNMAKELYVAEPDGDDDDEVKDLLASALLEEMGVV
jgi:hypothetical protein